MSKDTLTADVVPQIVAEAQATGRGGRLDLREFQTRLYKQQRHARTAGREFERSVAKLNAARRAKRVRMPAVGDLKVVDTRRSHDNNRLYFELGNGQCVRADRAADRAVRTHEAAPGEFPTFTILKGRRKAPFKNFRLRGIVANEVEKNAVRGEKGAA